MAWIELHQSIWTHRKALALGDALDIHEMYAASHVIRLWTWALDNAPEGVLPDSPRIIARSAGWEHDADQFVTALVQSGWLDHDGETYCIHDWADYAGRLIDRRRENAERKRRGRAEEPSIKEDVRETSNGHPPDVRRKSVATVPNRTGPNQTIPETGDVYAASAAARAPEAEVFAYYKARIQPQARVSGRDQIRARLKTFSKDELCEAVDHFAADGWSMEHNGSRGAPWFFSKDQRIEHYLHMTPRIATATNGHAKLAPDRFTAPASFAEATP